MKFMMIVKSTENAGPPPKSLMDAIGQLGIEATRSGRMVEMGGLHPTVAGARVRLTGGRIAVIDGPFTEAKEVIGGFAVFDVKSKQEAIVEAERFMELHRQHWPGWEGETEVRQIFEEGEMPGA